MRLLPGPLPMSFQRQVLSLSAYFLRALAAVALAGAWIAPGGANAEIFRKEDLLRGIASTLAQCDAAAQTFWLHVHERDFCVRYYLSPAGDEGSRPFVFLQGDQLG